MEADSINPILAAQLSLRPGWGCRQQHTTHMGRVRIFTICGKTLHIIMALYARLIMSGKKSGPIPPRSRAVLSAGSEGTPSLRIFLTETRKTQPICSFCWRMRPPDPGKLLKINKIERRKPCETVEAAATDTKQRLSESSLHGNRGGKLSAPPPAAHPAASASSARKPAGSACTHASAGSKPRRLRRSPQSPHAASRPRARQPAPPPPDHAR